MENLYIVLVYCMHGLAHVVQMYGPTRSELSIKNKVKQKKYKNSLFLIFNRKKLPFLFFQEKQRYFIPKICKTSRTISHMYFFIPKIPLR